MAKLFNNKKRYKPILKWPKEMRKHFSKLYKKDGQIFNIWSAFLIVREMENRNKVSFKSFLLDLLLQRWQKSSVVRNASRGEEICTFHCSLLLPSWETRLRTHRPSKTKIVTCYCDTKHTECPFPQWKHAGNNPLKPFD